MKKKFLIIAAISILTWSVLSVGIYYVALNFAIPDDLARLDERGHRTIGRVTGREASDHERVDYEFSVGDTRYTGSGRAGRGNAQFEDLTPGTSVHVTHDPAEPGNSMLGFPEYDIQSTELLVKSWRVRNSDLSDFHPVWSLGGANEYSEISLDGRLR